jgi:hypothetical protein
MSRRKATPTALHLRAGRGFEAQTICGRIAEDASTLVDRVAFVAQPRACKNCLRSLRRDEERKNRAFQALASA